MVAESRYRAFGVRNWAFRAPFDSVGEIVELVPLIDEDCLARRRAPYFSITDQIDGGPSNCCCKSCRVPKWWVLIFRRKYGRARGARNPLGKGAVGPIAREFRGLRDPEKSSASPLSRMRFAEFSATSIGSLGFRSRIALFRKYFFFLRCLRRRLGCHANTFGGRTEPRTLRAPGASDFCQSRVSLRLAWGFSKNGRGFFSSLTQKERNRGICLPPWGWIRRCLARQP